MNTYQRQKLVESLKSGKNLRIKHPDFNFYINTKIKLDENSNLAVGSLKITLPQKASKLEKLLMKLVKIYCSDVLENNLYSYVLESNEYKKLQFRLSRGPIAF